MTWRNKATPPPESPESLRRGRYIEAAKLIDRMAPDDVEFLVANYTKRFTPRDAVAFAERIARKAWERLPAREEA